MNIHALIMMAVVWTTVSGFTIYFFIRVLKSKSKNKQNPPAGNE